MDEKKKLGTFDIYTLGVGGCIGSGIFVMLGFGIAYTGRSIGLAVALGCVYMLFAYFYQFIMPTMFVFPGGDYDMKAMLFGPTLTGVSGLFNIGMSFSMAMYSLAMIEYAGIIFPGIVPYTKPIAILILTLFFASTIRGSKFVAMLSNIMTVVLLVAIGLFVIMGLPKVQSGYLEPEGFFMNGMGGFIQAISVMAFACQGTTMTPVSMMSVTKNPKRTIPVAIIYVTLTVGVVYGLMAIVASGVLPIEQVAGQSLALVAHQIFPNWLYIIFILGGAVFAIATSLISLIAMLRHPTQALADDGWLPKVFTKTTKSGYPYVSQLIYYFLSTIPVLLGFSIDGIVSLLMVPMMLMNAYLNFALIKLVKKYPEQWAKSTLKMPMPVFNVLCIASVICALLVSYNLFVMMAPKEMIFCVILVVVCFVIATLRLKTGAVNKEELLKKRDLIAQRALEATEQA